MKKPAQWKVKRNVFLWDRTRQLLSFSAVLNSRIMSPNFRCLPVPVYVSQFLYVSQFPYMFHNFRICLPVPVYISQFPYTSPNFGIMSLNSLYISFPVYVLQFRLDWGEFGGGILVFVKEGIQAFLPVERNLFKAFILN